MNCADIRPNLEAYALDALDSITRAKVERHLQTCAACRETVASFRNVTSQLPNALGKASPLRPPASLKNRLLQSVQADLQSQAHSSQVTTHQSQSAPPQSAQETAVAAPKPRRTRGLGNPRLWFASLAVSTAVIVALLAWAVAANVQMQQAVSSAQAAREQMEQLQQQQELAVPVLDSLNAQEIVLHPADPTSPTYGKVLIEPNKPTIVFVAYNLPPLPSNQKYVLWTTTKGVTQLVKSFEPNESGFALVAFLADRTDPILKEILVTRQSPSKIYPSGDRVLVWQADPNDSSDAVTFSSIFPRPTESLRQDVSTLRATLVPFHNNSINLR